MEELFVAEQDLAPVEWARQMNRVQKTGGPVTLSEFQRTLRHDEVFLEYVLDDPNSFCLAFTKTSAKLHRLASSKDIIPAIHKYWENLKAQKNTDENALHLHKLVLSPLPDYLRKARLVISSDSDLNLLPFESLRRPDGRFLIESHTVTYVPSATVLALLRTGAPQLTPPFPLLAAGGSKLGQGRAASANSPVMRGALDLTGANFESLPSVESELRSIGRLVSDRSRILVGENATERKLKSEPLGKFAVVHLAAHAFTDPTFPDRSAILLGTGPADQEDGLLQLREIRNLNLNAAMVTLSACDAASGTVQGQNGMASLVNAFLFAGARSVVASLWPAEDTFTASLMTRFYKHLAAGADRGHALQKAKLEMLQRFGSKAVPFYWAGFVLVGEGAEGVPFRR